ncbi:MAG TPA: hypothetical protein VMR70_01805, partial [Flavisolibacter sp.]|nr:hypothetical protein [Flavisolibacter sp.]
MANKALSHTQLITTVHNQINHKMKQSQTPIIAFSPVVLPVAGRHADLEMKVTAPANGKDLPVILLSHGHGASNFLSSYKGYGPLADFFAAEGFVVIQQRKSRQVVHNLYRKKESW